MLLFESLAVNLVIYKSQLGGELLLMSKLCTFFASTTTAAAGRTSACQDVDVFVVPGYGHCSLPIGTSIVVSTLSWKPEISQKRKRMSFKWPHQYIYCNNVSMTM